MAIEDNILVEIESGRYRDLRVPGHRESRKVFGVLPREVRVVDAASTSEELAIISLVLDGRISPMTLAEIYSNLSDLRLYLTRTMEAFGHQGEMNMVRALNDLIVLGMWEVPGWER